MKRFLSRVGFAILGVLVGTGVALALSLLPPSRPSRAQTPPPPSSISSCIYQGMLAPSPVTCEPWDPRPDPGWVPEFMKDWNACWHDDEGLANPHSAVDINWGAPMADAGLPVQLWYGGVRLNVTFSRLTSDSGTTCTGVRAEIRDTSGAYRGDIRYLHIDVPDGVFGTSWQLEGELGGSPYFYRDLGRVSLTQPGRCFSTAPHLHQSADVADATTMYSNFSVAPAGTWVHRFDHAPSIGSLAPTVAASGPQRNVTLTVDGSGFLPRASVRWQGRALATTWVSTNRVTATLTASELAAAGAYAITVTNPDGRVSPSQWFTVINPPGSPSGLGPNVITATSIELGWVDNSTDETYFEVLCRPGGATTAFVSCQGATAAASTTGATVLPSAVVGSNVRLWTHAGLVAGARYEYQVRACNEGVCSAPSNIAIATAGLSAPAGTRTGAVTSTSIEVLWNDTAVVETTFTIECRTGSRTAFAPCGRAAANETRWVHTGLIAATTYDYQVRACTAAGCSPPSPIASGVTAAPTAPAAPSNLRVGAVTASSIEVLWTDNSSDETTFNVECRTGTAAFALCGQTRAAVTAWTHTGLRASTPYVYQVRACNAVGCSAAAGPVTGTTATSGSTSPVAPAGLSTGTITASSIQLLWTDRSSDETRFDVWSAPTGTAAWTITSLGANVTTWIHSGLPSVSGHDYWVQACNVAGCSAFSNGITASTQTVTSAPVAPSGLTTGTVTATSVQLRWSDMSTNEATFEAWWVPAGGSAWSTAVLGANTTTWTHTGLATGATYQYYVRACNAAGCSAYSNGISVTTTSGLPAAPTNLRAGTVTGSLIQVLWTDNAFDETLYRWWMQYPAGNWVSVDLPANSTAYSVGGLSGNTTYVLWVQACNATGCTGAATSILVTTSAGPPTAPSNLAFWSAASSSITVRWTDNSFNETSFRVWFARWLGTGWGSFTPGYAPANQTLFTLTGLPAATWYLFYVDACNDAGCSPLSNDLIASTLAAGSLAITASSVLSTDDAGALAATGVPPRPHLPAPRPPTEPNDRAPLRASGEIPPALERAKPAVLPARGGPPGTNDAPRDGLPLPAAVPPVLPPGRR